MSHKTFIILICLALIGILGVGCQAAENVPGPVGEPTTPAVEQLQGSWPPAGEPVDIAPVLQWQHFPGATSYHLQVIDSQSGSVVIDQLIGDTAFDPNTPDIPIALDVDASGASPLEKGASYTWTVAAQDANGVTLAELNSFFLVKADLAVLEPADGASVGVSPLLRWASYPGATQYHILVLNSDAFPPEVVLDQVTDDTSLTVTPELIPGIGYSLTVQALDGDGVTLAESNTLFTVEE
jgi:hypothetical protein